MYLFLDIDPLAPDCINQDIVQKFIGSINSLTEIQQSQTWKLREIKIARQINDNDCGVLVSAISYLLSQEVNPINHINAIDFRGRMLGEIIGNCTVVNPDRRPKVCPICNQNCADSSGIKCER